MFLVVLAGDNVEFEQVQDKQNLKNKVTISLKKGKVTTMLKFESFSTRGKA